MLTGGGELGLNSNTRSNPSERKAVRQRERARAMSTTFPVVVTTPAPLAPLRLTARGRLLLGASGLVVALSLISATSALGSGDGAVSTASELSTYEVITVLPGESLWSIAGEVAPEANRADVVAAIVDLNGLNGSALHSGQRLRVPTSN